MKKYLTDHYFRLLAKELKAERDRKIKALNILFGVKHETK